MNGAMTGHLPLPLGTAAQASLERAFRLAALTPGQHLLGAVLESLERVVRLEAGVLLTGAAVRAGVVLESLERAEDLTRDGNPLEVHGVLESLERVDLVQVGAAERVANPRDRRVAGLLALLHGVLPPIPGAVQESQARADQAEGGTVMAGRQVAGRQVASQARADHGIKLASWFNNLHW